MPRIVPIQLLKCLKVLLDDNGGILSAGEVKRLASLMTKYSKKLVSKCIYVQILKCTKTELLGEFMGAGGWSLVYTWLNDAIRAMNWPLVQEILELLLLCPVDVNRLKINSAPKLVKGLCKDGGNEGVRILAKRLVEQWLKVVTENPEATLSNSTTASAATMTPQATTIKAPPVAVVAPMVTPTNIPQASLVNTTNQISSPVQQQQQQTPTQSQTPTQIAAATKVDEDEEEEEEEPEDAEDDCHEEEDEEEEEQDPLGGVQESTSNSYSLTPAQKKASESGLVYKIVVKNGNQFLAKVPKTTAAATEPELAKSSEKDDEEAEATDNVIEEPDVEDEENDAAGDEVVENNKTSAVAEADENSSSLDKPEKENDSNSGNEDDSKAKPKSEDTKKSEDKKSLLEDKEKSTSSSKDGKSSKDKERRSSSSSVDKEKDRDGRSSKPSSSSSSSGHRSSSSHKSSSSSSKSYSSSTSKSKSSSSSSSSHRSSSDKHRSDKDRSSSSKDKDRSSSSSSSKHRSSSSSSKSGSSSSKDKYRDKEKYSSSSSSSSKSKDKDRDSSTLSDKDKSNTSSSSSSGDKLGKLSKKSKEDSSVNSDDAANKATSITIPSKKASMSIEFRKDADKSKTVKTYKSNFRSHGLTEEAPPPPSRKGLKKPSSSTPTVGSILPTSLPSSLKRSSPPPRDSPTEKKPKIDMNSVAVANEKPGAIKLIPPKKIQTLVETNLFSDALSAATGPKKVAKRKRSNTPAPGSTNAGTGKEGASPPNSPEVVSKVMPLKFYQDTLDESKTEDSKSDKENEDQEQAPASNKATDEDANTDKENDDDDDDIPLKKVKEDIDQKVAQEKKMDLDSNVIDITQDGDEKEEKKSKEGSPNDDASSDTTSEVVEVKKPGPGCGPNGPPGVLMLHRRKGPKKKLTWRPQETLEQVRFFELDENERVNVTKTSFMDMKNLERFNERDAIVLARRGFNQEDNMEPTTTWKPVIEVDDVPPHPEGNQSKQRQIQAEREMTTLRALYFTQALIPDSPAEAEIEPIFNHDIPLIPLDDLTGNPDAVNDFTSMPWPEPRGSPKDGDNSSMAGTGGLGSPVDMFGGPKPPIGVPIPNNGSGGGGVGVGYGGGPFNPVISPFVGNQGPNGPPINAMQNSPQGPWQRPPNGMGGNGPMMGNPFNNNHGSPIMDMGGPPRSMGGGPGPGHMMNNGPPQNFNNQFGPGNNNNNPFAGPGPMNPFGGPPGNNFGVMGPGGPMVPPHMMNGMGPGPMMGNNGPPMMNGPNNRNNGGNWRSGGGPNFQDNNGGGNGGGNWRPAGPGPNNRGGNGGGGNGNNNNGICKAFMRGHCRVGKSCKFIHPSKNKRI